ncbi:MAG: hypothetical protein Q7T16_04765 [Candidatus Burarchaeum sp.]|nr:hypothetical protein [Candidatus Burarchaeum sp.]MDO8339941.1 hypothetical protein [Candidatus Burarchaeum sp.]
MGGWKKPKHLGAVVKQFPDTAQGKANAAYFANERTGLEQHTIVVPTLTMVGSLELFDIVEVPRIVLIEPKTEPALK